jgi:predicted transcriptional regulator of viral defense system
LRWPSRRPRWVSLLSALRFHGLTTQSPHEVWLTLSNKARAPKVKCPKLRIIRANGPGFTEMVEEDLIDGVTVKVYSPAKTVADCFKHRSKIGLDVALEALRDSFRGGQQRWTSCGPRLASAGWKTLTGRRWLSALLALGSRSSESDALRSDVPRD